MEEHTAIVHVDGTYNSAHIVGHHIFGVDKAGGVLKDLYSSLQQRLVMGSGQLKYQLFVRDMGGDDAYIHSGFGGIAQGGIDAVADDEIGGHNIDVPLGLGDQVQIYCLTHRLVVQGIVGVGLYKAIFSQNSLGRQGGGPQGSIVHLDLPDIFPHGEEHHRHAPGCFSFYQDGAVLPVTEAGFLVDILVGQVDAAGESSVSVDDAQLPVVPVVHADGNDRLEPVEEAAGDTGLLLKFFGVIGGQGAKGTHVVIDHPYVHAGSVLFLQNFHDGVPEHTGGQDEILQKDIMFGLFQFLQHSGEGVVSQRKVSRPGIGIHRAAGILLQIAGLIYRILAQHGEFFCLVIVLQLLQHGTVHTLHLPAHPGRQLVAAAQQIDQPAKHGEEQDGDDPGDLIPRVGLPADNDQYSQQREYHTGPVYVDIVTPGPYHGHQKYRGLQNDEHSHDYGALKEKGR